MLQHYLFVGLTAFYYSQSAANPQRRPHLLASLALQEAEGSRTVARIRETKADEIPLWLDGQMQRHIADEVRHAQIFTKAVEREGYFIDLDGKAAQQSLASVGEASMRRYHQVDDLATAPLPNLLASVLLAEEMGVLGFRCLLKALPDSLTATRAAIESVLKDEERHVSYLSDALRHFGATAVVHAYRRDLEGKLFQDLGKVVEFLTKPASERPSLVQPGQRPELSLV